MKVDYGTKKSLGSFTRVHKGISYNITLFEALNDTDPRTSKGKTSLLVIKVPVKDIDKPEIYIGRPSKSARKEYIIEL